MQVLILQLNKISGVFLEVTFFGIRLLQGRNSVPKDDFPDTSELQRSPETNEIKHWPKSWGKHRWSLEHGWRRVIVCSTKIHRKDIRRFRADWRRNLSQQDQETLGRNNGQICHHGSQRKALNKWAEDKPWFGRTRDQRGINFISDDPLDHEEIVK